MTSSSPTKSITELQQSLHRVYIRIFRAIKKEKDYPDGYNRIKQKYERVVYDNTRSAIQQSVIMANERTNRYYETQPYLTDADLSIIKRTTQEQVDSFWRKILLDVFRKQEQRSLQPLALAVGGAVVEDDLEAEDHDLTPPSDLDINAYLLAVSIASLFGSFASATLSKTRELADTIPFTTTTTPDGIEINEVQKPQVRWKTRIQETTCKVLPDGSEGCKSRDGRIYDADDSELQVHMPGYVHPHCNCELIPVV